MLRGVLFVLFPGSSHVLALLLVSALVSCQLAAAQSAIDELRSQAIDPSVVDALHGDITRRDAEIAQLKADVRQAQDAAWRAKDDTAKVEKTAHRLSAENASLAGLVDALKVRTPLLPGCGCIGLSMYRSQGWGCCLVLPSARNRRRSPS